MSKKVLLVTYTGDITGMIPELTRRLESRGAEVMRFDNDVFPTEAQIVLSQHSSGEGLRFRYKGREMRVGPEDAIWYRRGRTAEKLPQMERQMRHGAMLESKALLYGALAAAPCFVLDPPHVVRSNEHKPRQLHLARELGLEIPRSVMTNDPQEAREFIESCPNGAVAKMLSAFPVFDENGNEQVVFTTLITKEHLGKLDGLRYSPMVFQERIRKKLELRITVIGTRMFTACVDSENTAGADIDWRERGVTLLQSWKEYTLPSDIETKIGKYMERIGMQYSAVDVIVDPDGRHVFLEANPAGECFWMQYNSPNFPLSDALADVLLGEPGARRAHRA
ncbi:MAG: MvdD family ATP-grasp ribosomal peptide maturase [Polyangiaceae bacterium]|nr:MvdD family ATP-grasp ribosomal peptide maturase [Polyangiaceae bacterium]